MSKQQKLIDEGEIAADYLEQFLDILDFDGDIDLDVDGDRASVSIDGGKDLHMLVGRDGQVLEAVQVLTRLAVQEVSGERSRLMLDIANWRGDRRATLWELAAEGARRVLESGSPVELEPMSPFERKVVHDAIAEIAGVTTESTGEGRQRHVVLLPDDVIDDLDGDDDDYDDELDGDDIDDIDDMDDDDDSDDDADAEDVDE